MGLSAARKGARGFQTTREPRPWSPFTAHQDRAKVVISHRRPDQRVSEIGRQFLRDGVLTGACRPTRLGGGAAQMRALSGRRTTMGMSIAVSRPRRRLYWIEAIINGCVGTEGA